MLTLDLAVRERKPLKCPTVKRCETVVRAYYFANFAEKSFFPPDARAKKALFWLLYTHGVLTQPEIAKKYGYSRPHVSNYINEFHHTTNIKDALFRLDYGNYPF